MQKIIDISNVNRILLIQTAFLGDVTLTLYLVEAIKQILPKTDIYFVTTPNASSIAHLSESITQVLEFDKRDAHKGLKGINQISKQINKLDIDCTIAPHRSFRTSLLASKIKSPIKIGYNINSNSILAYNYRVVYHPALHEVDRLLSLLEPFGLTFSNFHKEDIYPNLIFSDKDIITLQSILNENDINIELIDQNSSSLKLEHKNFSQNRKPITAVAPGSVWKTKRWNAEYFSELISILQDKNCDPVLIGGKEDLEICNEIHNSTNCKSIAGITNLSQSILFLKYANLTITNDSAPTHFSDLVGTPVMTIFGPTSSIFGFAPFREKDIIIENESLGCRPCKIHGSNHCPLKTLECMNSIIPEFVANKALAKLDEMKNCESN